MSKGIEPISPKDLHATLGPGKGKIEEKYSKNRKKQRAVNLVKESDWQVFKPPKPSQAKTDSCNPFHNRTQNRTKEREYWSVINLDISKDREWVANAPRVGLLNTYCAGKIPRTGWSTKLSILKKTHSDGTLRLCQRSQLTLPPLNSFPPSVPIWHRLAKLSILILEGIIKKISMSAATMSR